MRFIIVTLMRKEEIRFESISSLGHDVVEILPWDLASIGGGSLQHFFELLDVHGLPKLFGHSFDVAGVDKSTVVVIEEVEYFINARLH